MSTPDYSLQVHQAFDLLRKGLGPFVRDQMKAEYKEGWIKECLTHRNLQFQLRNVELNAENQPEFDNAALLKIIIEFWKPVFKMDGRRGPTQQGIFSALIAWRNELEGHRTKDVSKVKAQDVINIVIQALWCVDAKDQAEEAEKLLQFITPQMADPPPAPAPPLVQSAQPSIAPEPVNIPSASVPPVSAPDATTAAKPPQTGRPVDFWGAYHFDFADALNEEIWQLSPVVQQEIQPSITLKQPGVIGAQQAMLDSPLPDGRDALPWVPDLVGKQWQDEDSLVIVGSAYAGFILEYSTRSAAIPLSQYATSSVQDFQSLFLRYVVGPDLAYYGPLKNLCSELGSAAHLSLVDLCRVSLVKRGTGTTQRMDNSSGIVREAPAIYEKYVESEEPSKWLWRRFAEGQARCIIALGQTCEHGLLRLFSRRGMTITQDEEPFFVPPIAHGDWANEYADPNRKLSYWLNNETWWTVRGLVERKERVWYVLPVYHPASHQNYDSGYQRTKKVLNQMRASSGG